MPDSVLHKPGPLDEGENELIQEHPIIGERIVAPIGLLAHLAPVIRAEHERWDGKGYPDDLSVSHIPRRQPCRIRLRLLPHQDLQASLSQSDRDSVSA